MYPAKNTYKKMDKHEWIKSMGILLTSGRYCSVRLSGSLMTDKFVDVDSEINREYRMRRGVDRKVRSEHLVTQAEGGEYKRRNSAEVWIVLGISCNESCLVSDVKVEILSKFFEIYCPGHAGKKGSFVVTVFQGAYKITTILKADEVLRGISLMTVRTGMQGPHTNKQGVPGRDTPQGNPAVGSLVLPFTLRHSCRSIFRN